MRRFVSPGRSFVCALVVLPIALAIATLAVQAQVESSLKMVTASSAQAPTVTRVRTLRSNTSTFPSPNVPVRSFDHVSITRDTSGAEDHVFNRNADRFTITNISARELIKFAYNMEDAELSDGPDWMKRDRYDIEGIVKEHSLTPSDDQLRIMVESLLVDRFHLKLSHRRSHAPIYTLVNIDGGAKLAPSKASSGTSDGEFFSGAQVDTTAARMFTKDGRVQLIVTAGTVGNLADFFTHQLGIQVVDQTGYVGRYDLALHWTAKDTESGPSLFTALQEQLGLKLELHESPIENFSVVKIERPS